MKKNILLLILFLLNIKTMNANIVFIDSIDSKEIVIQNSSLFVFDKDIYFLNQEKEDIKLFYQLKNGNLIEFFNDKLLSFNPSRKFNFLFMNDTNSMVFTYGGMDAGNGIVVKEKNNWTKYDQSNSDFKDSAPIYDVIFSKNGEMAIINTTDKISFIKDGQYRIKDCDEDFECMPRPFSKEIGAYFENCLLYLNSRRNFVRLCNNEINKIFSYQEFDIQSISGVSVKSFTIHNDRLYFSNIFANRIYSMKGDDIDIIQPISDEKLKEFVFVEGKPLLLDDFIFGNDGFLYCLYKEAVPGQQPTPGGYARLIKMTENFDIVEVLPLPNERNGFFNAVFKLVKDTKDTSNKKLYIPASWGFYIYDPEPTSVKDNAETGPASLFLTEIYPNPSGGLMNVRYASDVSNSGKIKMFISNVMGQRIKEFDHRGSYNISTGYGTTILDVSDIPTGTYQLVITDGNKYVSKNILVIR